MTGTDRIKLAEAMGWQRDEKWDAWILQVNDKQRDICRDPDRLPDPFTDANDCNALIKHLNGLGCEVHIMWPGQKRTDLKPHVKIFRYPDKTINWRGDNYMQGVCELALKVLDNE